MGITFLTIRRQYHDGKTRSTADETTELTSLAISWRHPCLVSGNLAALIYKDWVADPRPDGVELRQAAWPGEIYKAGADPRSGALEATSDDAEAKRKREQMDVNEFREAAKAAIEDGTFGVYC